MGLIFTMRFLYILLLIITFFKTTSAQFSECFMLDYSWHEETLVVNDSESLFFNFQLSFSEFSNDFDIYVENPIYVKCNDAEIKYLENLQIDSISNILSRKGISSKKLILRGELMPVIKNREGYQKMIFCEVKVDFSYCPQKRNSSSLIENSVLSSGKWYKIGLATNGIYRLSYQDLLDLGMDLSDVLLKRGDHIWRSV